MDHSQLRLLLVFLLCLSIQNAAVRGSNSGENNGDLDSSYFFYQQPAYPKDCQEVLEQCSVHNSSGVHLIQPEGYPEPFKVYCDDENGDAWTVILRRFDGGIHFDRSWSEHKNGFGFLTSEVWLGNEKLAFLTNQRRYQLRIDLVNSVGSEFYVIYDNFRISDEGSDFNLVSVGQYSGTADSVVTRCPGNAEHTQNIFNTCTVLPTDCYEVFKSGNTSSGVYTILPQNWPGSPFKVHCNMDNGGGWTVFQKRVNGSVDFFLAWDDYKQGFGSLNHEFWLGNDKIASMTAQRDYQLRIDLVNSRGTPYYVTYTLFRINNEDDNYRLILGDFGGNTGRDALDYHRGLPFSTRDRDNDIHSTYDCAQYYHGAWWYNNCHYSNLNGGYFDSGFRSVWWQSLPGGEYNIRNTEMKIRPVATN